MSVSISETWVLNIRWSCNRWVASSITATLNTDLDGKFVDLGKQKHNITNIVFPQYCSATVNTTFQVFWIGLFFSFSLLFLYFQSTEAVSFKSDGWASCLVCIDFCFRQTLKKAGCRHLTDTSAVRFLLDLNLEVRSESSVTTRLTWIAASVALQVGKVFLSNFEDTKERICFNLACQTLNKWKRQEASS